MPKARVEIYLNRSTFNILNIVVLRDKTTKTRLQASTLADTLCIILRGQGPVYKGEGSGTISIWAPDGLVMNLKDVDKLVKDINRIAIDLGLHAAVRVLLDA